MRRANTRRALVIVMLAHFPNSTSNELWQMLWACPYYYDGIGPDDFWPTLDRLRKKGLVISEGSTPQIRWRLV